jgi:diguanylate cyclase (GGDEF)-like protein
MELINGRYKIENIHRQEPNGTIYEVRDLLQSNNKILLKLFNEDSRNGKIIDYYVNNFLQFTSINHKHIQSVYNFDIVNTIDNKTVNGNQYFYTKEYLEGKKLIDILDELNQQDIFTIMRHIFLAVDYLHFRGLFYQCVSPNNIYIYKENGNIRVKLKDIAANTEQRLMGTYDEIDSYFISPEIKYDHLKVSEKSDIYSVGMLIYTLLIGEIKGYNHKELYNSINVDIDENNKKELIYLIDSMLDRDTLSRPESLKIVFNFINNIAKDKINLSYKEERERLNFKVKIIGREREINRLCEINEDIKNRINKKRLLVVSGESGLGKTRLLQEFEYRLRMKGESIYTASVIDDDKGELKPIIRILKQIIKNCDKEILNKYGCELIKIIPELRFIVDVKPSTILSGNREKLRLFDRITRFILDSTKNKPTFIFIDDLHNADTETLKIIDFIIRNSSDYPLLFIVSYDKDKLRTKQEKIWYFNTWLSLPVVEEIKILRLNLQETAELTKNILGINFKPIRFSTRIMQETGGNPRFIEEVIKNLYAVGELFIDENGDWETDTKNYSEIYIPSTINEVIKNQIDLLEPDLYEIAKVVSVFNTSVSKDILSKVLDVKIEKLDESIKTLVSMKILEQMVEDWGYTYDYYNKQVKKYVYYNIPQKERIILHKKIAQIIEQTYIKDNKGNIDELIHHFTLSQQTDKAVDYAIRFAKNMQGLLVNTQSILLWESAYRLLKDKINHNKLEVQINLARLYSKQGYNDKALNMYNQAISSAIHLNNKEYVVICKNSIGEIYYRRNKLDEAQKIIEEAKNLAESIDYPDGYLKSVVLLNRINFTKGNNEEIIELTEKYLSVAIEKKKYQYIAHFYNQIGVVYMFSSKVEVARDYFEKSIEYFSKSGDLLESNLPINNIGVIYGDHFDNLDKAMEYFEKGLEICKRYNSIQHEITFLVNIAEMYMRKHEYNKALEVMEKAHQIATDLEDHGGIFLSNINMAQIYLYLGEYDKCFKYYQMIRKEFKKLTVERQNLSRYYGFLCNFYYKLGQWDKAIKYSIKTKESSFKLDLKQYLNADTIHVISNYYKTGYFDLSKVNSIRERYRKSHLSGERRESLLELAACAILAGEKELAKDILKEDSEIINSFTSEYLEFYRNIITAYVSNEGLEKNIDLVGNCTEGRCQEIQMFIDYLIGDKYFKRKEYYKAAFYYINALETLYRYARKIPDDIIRLGYIKSKGIDYAKKRLDKIKAILIGEDISVTNITKDKNIGVNEYFDFSVLEALFEKDETFRDTFLNQEQNRYGKLREIGDVIKNFTDNHKYNLEIILEFAVQQTFAKKGYILGYSEGSNELEVLASIPNESISPNLKTIISTVKQKGQGILIKNTFSKNRTNMYLSMQNDGISLICIPIFRNSGSSNIYNLEDRRKKYNKVDTGDIIGYIYLETDRLFNRFDEERYRLITTLSYLAFINIDNYYLRITSSIDKMTGVYTRKYFDLIYNKIYNKAAKEYSKFAVIMIDIDRFKNVNDTFGHQKGDEILSNIGSILLENTRATDIVARYGGEEFIIILNDVNTEDARLVAEKIREKVENAQLIGPNYPLTISLGVSVFPSNGKHKEELIEKADQALYCAKELGRNRVIIWSADISGSTKRLDKLAGIVTGNTVQDQRIVLAMIEMISLIRDKKSNEEKIYSFLGRLIEITAASEGILFILDEKKTIKQVFARERFLTSWKDSPKYNSQIIERVISTKNGEYLIDWEDIGNIDVITGNPNWKSIIVVPVIKDGIVKGVLQISVPIKEKEFDYNSYNFVSTISDILAVFI